MKTKKITIGNFNITYIWNGFKDRFGEPEVEPKKFKPKFVTLSKDMLDSEILAEYKPEEISLDELAYLLESKEGLLTNGYANIFYIKDEKGTLWAVLADWNSGRGGWHVHAFSVVRLSGWDAGRQVVSRQLLDPLTSPKANDSLPEFLVINNVSYKRLK